MITLKSQREIDEMKKSGALLASVHEALREFIKPGVTTMEINQLAHDLIVSGGGIPAQIGYEGYQYATCTSVNDEICHGLPSNRVLKSGDLVKVDMCVNLNGAMSDSCWSYAVGEVDPKISELMRVTKEALYKGIEQAVIGNRVGDIGHAIENYVKPFGFGVVQDFVGHGIGPTIHEGPMIPHYGEKGKGLRLKEGMTITIEPMINTGTYHVKMSDNGWTASTKDGGISCQYEHTLAITKDGPIILTKQSEGE